MFRSSTATTSYSSAIFPPFSPLSYSKMDNHICFHLRILPSLTFQNLFPESFSLLFTLTFYVMTYCLVCYSSRCQKTKTLTPKCLFPQLFSNLIPFFKNNNQPFLLNLSSFILFFFLRKELQRLLL